MPKDRCAGGKDGLDSNRTGGHIREILIPDELSLTTDTKERSGEAGMDKLNSWGGSSQNLEEWSLSKKTDAAQTCAPSPYIRPGE